MFHVIKLTSLERAELELYLSIFFIVSIIDLGSFEKSRFGLIRRRSWHRRGDGNSADFAKIMQNLN
jgi:hypothetical protein